MRRACRTRVGEELTMKERFTLAAGYPHPYQANLTILTAVRIADRYRGQVPTVQQLMQDMGMHRATAYRWRAALRMARHTPATESPL